MKRLVFFALVLFALSHVVIAQNQPHLAAQAYIVAVADNAPASQVVFAANFAQQIKADTGAEFIGTTETDLEDTFEGDFGPRVVILLTDETARLYSADAQAYKTVASAAREYLENAGYSVLAFGEDGPEFVEVSEPEEMPEEETRDEAEDDVAEIKDEKKIEVKIGPPKEIIQAEPSQPEETLNLPVEREESIVSKFLNWLKELFN